jgi:hypothetical protein
MYGREDDDTVSFVVMCPDCREQELELDES